MCSWQKMRNENFWLDSVWWFGCDFDNLWCCDCFCIASWKSISYLVYNRMIQLQDTLDWNGDRYGYTVGRERYIRSGHTVDQEMSAQFWYLLFDTSLKRWNDNKIKCWWNQIYVYILNGAINHCSLCYDFESPSIADLQPWCQAIQGHLPCLLPLKLRPLRFALSKHLYIPTRSKSVTILMVFLVCAWLKLNYLQDMKGTNQTTILVFSSPTFQSLCQTV